MMMHNNITNYCNETFTLDNNAANMINGIDKKLVLQGLPTNFRDRSNL